MRYSRTWRVAKFAVWVAIGITALGLLVATLWNNLVPELFGGPMINFWQALGLLVLMRLLFMGFRPRWSQYSDHAGHWQKRWEEKMAALTPEQREKIKQAYAQRCAGKLCNWQLTRTKQAQPTHETVS